MAITEAATGTLTTNGSEQTLATETTAGTYQLVLDLSAVDNGDELTVRAYVKVITAGASTLAFAATYVNAQGLPAVFSVPVMIAHEIKVTVEHAVGSADDIPWSLLRI